MLYFKNLLELLKLEKEEDLFLFKKLTESTSISSRREAGLAWYPIAIKGSELSRGDYITLEVERPSHQDLNHQLRFGASAELFSNFDPKMHHIDGTITHCVGNRLKITLKVDELPEWSKDGKLGISMLFDSNSYNEMQSAIKKAMAISENPNENSLIEVLTGKASPEFDVNHCNKIVKELNTLQNVAVNRIISAKDIAIVHGPPGTGKTTTLVKAIFELYKLDNKPILVVAPSNTAVDLLTEKLADFGMNVLRVGNPAKVSERLLDLTLDGKMNTHSSMKEVKKLKKQAAEFKSMAHKYKRSFGRSEQEQRKALFSEAHKIMDEAWRTEQYIIDDLTARAEVITATLVGANHYTIKNIQFHTVIIDEAGQALEPACWIPLVKARKVIFAGDHMQLSPTIKSQEAARKGLSNTLMEKCLLLYPEAVIFLDEQYRMNTEIMKYPSRVFYNDKLKAHISVENHILFPRDMPFTFIDTAGCSFNEKTEGTSTTNPEEASFLVKHLNGYINELDQYYSHLNFPSIGIISPYKQQVLELKNILENYPGLLEKGNKISINTIDSFQGQERDIIFISLARSNQSNGIGFLADIRRMNVAITRARKKLVIIGDSSTLSKHPFYSGLISFAEEINAYKSAWEFFY